MMMVERENMKKKEKSQILYFDIFYVDLDRTLVHQKNSTGVSFSLPLTRSLACSL